MRLISVVMPALNEAPNIGNTVSRIPVEELAFQGFDTEILVVDNGSVDGTDGLARAAGARVVVERQRGYGNAYRKGFEEARGEIICTMDSDGTYPAEVLPALISKLIDEDLDFINTNRFTFMTNGVMSKRNKLGNALLTRATQALFRFPFQDSQSGMWVFRAELLGKMRLQARGMALSQEIKIEAVSRLRARCAEVPIHYGYRQGSSKLRVWRDGAGNFVHLLRSRLS
ncbi:MAG: glycosyltransferase family 2 protein [Chloroflexi bacterium]|nr:glycosyltransferase family 2 protein [Chloroflexota bacterium]